MCKTTLIIAFFGKKWNEKLVNNSRISHYFSKVIHVQKIGLFPSKKDINSDSRVFNKLTTYPYGLIFFSMISILFCSSLLVATSASILEQPWMTVVWSFLLRSFAMLV